jgi:ketosteroid isomerase-like protein
MNSRILLLMVCFAFWANTHAQSRKQEIESSIEALNKATIAQDGPMLEKLTADELSYGHSTGLVEDKTAYVKDILSGSTRFFHIDNAEQTIHLASDLAIVRNICSIKGTKDGSAMDVKIGVLMIWRKEGTDWKLLARQGYKLQ